MSLAKFENYILMPEKVTFVSFYKLFENESFWQTINRFISKGLQQLKSFKLRTFYETCIFSKQFNEI